MHLKHLLLKGLQPKTIEAYARGMRRIGAYFSFKVSDLGEDDLVEYFTDLMRSHSRRYFLRKLNHQGESH